MEKKLLREWISLDYSPSLIKESREKNDGKLIVSGIIQKADCQNQNKRIYPNDILRREIENYQKAVREKRAVGELDHPECVSSGYYLLSSQGWVPIEEVKEGDNILTLDTNSKKIVEQAVTKKIDQQYSGKMVRIWNDKRTIEQLLTPSHRVLLWDRKNQPYYVTAAEFHNLNISGDSKLSHSYILRAGIWEGKDDDVAVLPGTDIQVDSCDWAAFVGIWLAEGYATINSELVDYNGRVYCVTVPNGNWLARSPSGQVFWTGNSSSVSLDRVSHIVREMWWDGNNVCGKIEILPTPKGQILEKLLESGVTIGISSRGVGSTEKNGEGLDVVQQDYTIICFDIVSEPSTPGAYLMPESKQYTQNLKISKADRIYRAINNIVLK